MTGAVQGVGFRPFVHRLAGESGLAGWVRNSVAGVEIEIEGGARAVERFVARLRGELPAHASIAELTQRQVSLRGGTGFEIRGSEQVGGAPATGEILPDLATCELCLAELFDPDDRRSGYPFINCTHCGPRFSIAQTLPYDRANTTMRRFAMCTACSAEYGSPSDRRFHAQPNACPDCGPQLSWLDTRGTALAGRADALEQAAQAIERGRIVAVKGIGGFHLFADARCARAIALLRTRKRRPAKPLALMVPSLDVARELCAVVDTEAVWLRSAAAPVVLLRRRSRGDLPDSLAPGNPHLGVMLPYSPLHHLLMRRLGFPVVATSGNLGDEPICIDNDEAVHRLRGVADGFLVHDRDIARAVDDSVLRVGLGRELILRRSRGFAPAPIRVPELATPVVAFGGDLKGTMAVADRGRVVVSQHFGDLASAASRRALERHLTDFPALCRAQPEVLACDRHPGYHSRELALAGGRPVVEVQHHHAHVAACMAENRIDTAEEVLGVAWDGTGYGDDGTIWGGEFLRCRGATYRRFAWLRPFPLPGGDKAVRDPRFAALGCLHAAEIPVDESPLADGLTAEELRVAEAMIRRGVNTPLCSSAGRLFDAVAALCGLARVNEFEGQAAMALEFAAGELGEAPPLPCGKPDLDDDGQIDWTPVLRAVVQAIRAGEEVGRIARGFHHALAELVERVAGRSDCTTIALTGGCFQNASLTELCVARLRAAGLEPIWHRRVPPNDGGLAVGQAVIASRMAGP